MKVQGIIEDDGHAYIHAFIACPQIKRPAPIVFLVDLGATTTTILEGDCRRLGIDYDRLEKAPEQTVVPGGRTETYMLRDVILIFETKEGEFQFERLNRVDVIRRKPTVYFCLLASLESTSSADLNSHTAKTRA